MRQRCANCGWLSVNPSGAMFCGYSDERTWEDGSCMAWKDNEESHTNADRIRAMSDEEIENWFWWMHKEMMRYTDSRVFLHDWLKQEASE